MPFSELGLVVVPFRVDFQRQRSVRVQFPSLPLPVAQYDLFYPVQWY